MSILSKKAVVSFRSWHQTLQSLSVKIDIAAVHQVVASRVSFKLETIYRVMKKCLNRIESRWTCHFYAFAKKESI